MDRPNNARIVSPSCKASALNFPDGMEDMLKTGLAILWRAFHFARDLNVSPQEYSVGYDSLENAGLTLIDLRWLLARGLVEVRPISSGSEVAIGSPQLFLEKAPVGLILSGAGVKLADRLFLKTVPPEVYPSPSVNEHMPVGEAIKLTEEKPHWDRERKELCFAGLIIKQFRWSAVNQETILMTFEEDGWPPRIDDPLPQNPNQDPKQRLHDTIKCLNRNHKKRVIRFRGDGTGEGIRWLLVESSEIE